MRARSTSAPQLAASFWGAIIAFVADAVVTVGVSLVTQPKPDEELRGLVWGLTRKEEEPEAHDPARRRLVPLGRGCSAACALGLVVILNIIFI